MKKEYFICDKCGIGLGEEINTVLDAASMQLFVGSEATGSMEWTPVDLCKECYTGLIKWFGKTNPYSGLEFERK